MAEKKLNILVLHFSNNYLYFNTPKKGYKYTGCSSQSFSLCELIK